MKIASGIVQMLDGIDDEFARLVISLGIPDWERLRKNKPEEKQFPPFSSRLAPNEEETAAERCSEKLVDLVVLLTTKVFSSKNDQSLRLAESLRTQILTFINPIFKLDNNVEDLRKELTDNINENIERWFSKNNQNRLRCHFENVQNV